MHVHVYSIENWKTNSFSNDYKRQILSWALVDQFDFHSLALDTAFVKLIQQVQINYHVIGN